jgi:hypothetical protein
MLATAETTVHADILKGADAIAEFMFGDPAERRRIYRLKDKHGLPVFHLGAIVCARRSTLVAWITEQELASAVRPPRTPPSSIAA